MHRALRLFCYVKSFLVIYESIFKKELAGLSGCYMLGLSIVTVSSGTIT